MQSVARDLNFALDDEIVNLGARIGRQRRAASERQRNRIANERTTKALFLLGATLSRAQRLGHDGFVGDVVDERINQRS